MGRTILGLIVLVFVLFGGYFTMFARKSTAGEEYRLAARELVSQVEGYQQRPDYFNWLVDYAHDHVFNDAFKAQPAGRRRIETWVDERRYVDDLFHFMIEHARRDNALGVARALEEFYAGLD